MELDAGQANYLGNVLRLKAGDARLIAGKPLERVESLGITVHPEASSTPTRGP